ncbi:MAG TPA: MATE family efflux transporter [Steroidobacteraceae bacterium]|jgi:MATE family multidrug resistance protein|nr:MATE family efflux transporter [Steroidobacteraceae bacterium]
MVSAASTTTTDSGQRSHLRPILRLGGPLVINNLAYAGITFADTVMAGHISPDALAAVAVGSNALQLQSLIGAGMMMALAPLAAHDYGAGRDTAAGGYMRQAFWIALAMSILPVVVALFASRIYTAVGTAAPIIPTATTYTQAICCGVPAMFALQVLTYTSEGLGRTRTIMLMTVMALPVNVLLNWVFMFGHWGAPALGAVGAGVASAITLWLALAFMILLMKRPSFERFSLFAGFEWPSATKLRAILRLGLPFTGSLVIEGSLFIGATLMVSALGATVVAGHQVALSYSLLTYMIPAAFHSATTVRVGHMLGAGLPAEARRAGYVGIALCAGLMIVSAVVLVLARGPIAHIYTDDPAVLQVATTLLLLAGLFQVSDGVQLGCSGALRGYQDARIPLAITVVSYWGIGFTLALVFGIVRGGGAPGVWLGLIAGLTAAALMLAARYRMVSDRAIRREPRVA